MQESTRKTPTYHTDCITIGADPEFFLSRKGDYVSAHDIVPGTKDQPYPLKNGVFVQADGTAVEFNIPPAKTAEEFSDSINDALKQIRDLIPKEFSFEFRPSVKFDEAYFRSLPRTATELGCSPDFLSSTQGSKKIPPDLKRLRLEFTRAAGGHIHIGWGRDINIYDQGHFFDCCLFVNAIDSIFKSLEPRWDSDKHRPHMYGRGGAFRPKSYGVEYRGLSNKWLEYPKLWLWLFNNTQRVFNHMLNGNTNLTSFHRVTPHQDRKEQDQRIAYFGLLPFPVDFNLK